MMKTTTTKPIETTNGDLTVTRQFPLAKIPFLKFQVGRKETRPEQIPIWTGPQFRRLNGYREGSPVSVFRLLGFGETLGEAKAMAAHG